MAHERWMRLRADWPFLFAGIVATWLLISSSGVIGGASDALDRASNRAETLTSPELPAITDDSDATSNSPNSSEPNSSDPHSSTNGQPVAAGPVDVEVVGLHVSPDRDSPGDFIVNTTLQIKNRQDSNVQFQPDQVILRRAGGSKNISPKASSTGPVTVSPHLPLVAPVSFPVSADTGGGWEVWYRGTKVYSGYAR